LSVVIGQLSLVIGHWSTQSLRFAPAAVNPPHNSGGVQFSPGDWHGWKMEQMEQMAHKFIFARLTHDRRGRSATAGATCNTFLGDVASYIKILPKLKHKCWSIKHLATAKVNQPMQHGCCIGWDVTFANPRGVVHSFRISRL
jgi:hypothetical protein